MLLALTEKIEKAFYNLETSLGLKKEEQTVELVHREHIRNTKRINWGRVAAIWAIPFIMVCFRLTIIILQRIM